MVYKQSPHKGRRHRYNVYIISAPGPRLGLGARDRSALIAWRSTLDGPNGLILSQSLMTLWGLHRSRSSLSSEWTRHEDPCSLLFKFHVYDVLCPSFINHFQHLLNNLTRFVKHCLQKLMLTIPNVKAHLDLSKCGYSECSTFRSLYIQLPWTLNLSVDYAKNKDKLIVIVIRTLLTEQR